MFVVLVEFRVELQRRSEFLRAVETQAAHSLERSPNCRVFDVAVDHRDPAVVVLYEVYDTHEDFAAHLRTAHFLAFDATTRTSVVSKTVRTLERLETRR